MHGCVYCSAQKKNSAIQAVRPIRIGNKTIQDFARGKRSKQLAWADFRIPLKLGVMSDPFQPCERKYRATMSVLKALHEEQYPFVISTKGKLVGDDEYAEIIADSKCVVQISLVDESFDRIERGCTSYWERVEIIRKLAKRGLRVVVRVQPFVPEITVRLVRDSIPLYADAGAYGLTVEGLKLSKPKSMFGKLVRKGNEWVYPKIELERSFRLIREACHTHGLKFFAAENRLRYMGDSLCCCGVCGLEDFTPNRANYSYFFFAKNKSEVKLTEAMKCNPAGSALLQGQTSYHDKMVQDLTFAQMMLVMRKKACKVFDLDEGALDMKRIGG